jgi:Zn-dependent M28 family amino/carboxypeptidase
LSTDCSDLAVRHPTLSAIDCMKKYIKFIYFILVIALLFIAAFFIKLDAKQNENGKSMIASIATQMSFGTRHVGTEGRLKTQDYIRTELNNNKVEVIDQKWEDSTGKNLNNIIGRINPESKNRIIVGAHYDSQQSASNDRPNMSVPGANDSASGVALLLEIARNYNSNDLKNVGVDLVFFDAEEYQPGNFESWSPKGSVYFADNLQSIYKSTKPNAAIVVDMICDKNLNFSKEFLSDSNAREQTQNIWNEGKNADATVFSNSVRTEIKDDHTPLAAMGIPSTLIIDFDYPYFHTTKDTIDKCSSKSLQTTYETVKNYIYSLDK